MNLAVGNNLCNEPGKKSVRINSSEVDDLEELGMADISASTVFSDLIEKAKKLKEIQEHKKKEHRETREKLRDEAELYGID